MCEKGSDSVNQRFALPSVDPFASRHLENDPRSVGQMLELVGASSLEQLLNEAVPSQIRHLRDWQFDPLGHGRGLDEPEAQRWLRKYASENGKRRSLLGMGYSRTYLPAVLRRNVLENPAWYTAYTPYQAEIAQGRLEVLLLFQTMISDLTGLPVANASLLDEATAAAEAMHLAAAVHPRLQQLSPPTFFVDRLCHPQTIAVVRTRAEAIGLEVQIGEPEDAELSAARHFGVLVQDPATDGSLRDFQSLADRARQIGVPFIVSCDPLALALVRPPGEFGADVAVGSTQRFGLPLGYGGPHAGFLAARERFARLLPGRIIGLSRDASGKPALRMALQTREQHIRREKATSNICTAQVLPAVLSALWAVYHGPDGIRAIAERVHSMAVAFAQGCKRAGHRVLAVPFFDTVSFELADGERADALIRLAAQRGIDLRRLGERSVAVAFDELVGVTDLEDLLELVECPRCEAGALLQKASVEIPDRLRRKTPYLQHPAFSSYRTEHEMLRFLKRLENRDVSLVHSMIPLGSCTMKLNAAAEMEPISWSEWSDLHPFVPQEHARGYARLIADLERWLGELTGLPHVSLQPNSGAQGEFAGLLTIRAYHRARGEGHRNVCLIPTSAHGTNPASAAMAGLQVVAIRCDSFGNVDVDDLRQKVGEYRDRLAAFMITYPSTHGVFEEAVVEMTQLVHEAGGQVYLDGANLNAQVGLVRPGDYGADVCHVNLHKTFCIPHGGGGPGMGPIAVASHLAPFLPTHPVIPCGGEQGLGTVSAAPWGSALILTIPWMYIAMMGGSGLREASARAILHANYMASRLRESYPLLFTGKHGRVAHEFILDLRPFKKSAGIEAEDVAKRLMDYGFHAPTMSFPVPGTLMIEPTESESKAELDRFCEALLAIREEIRAIETGRFDWERNPLKGAPHPADVVVSTSWDRPYSREQAAFPLPWVRERKVWPTVARIDNPYGDRNLVCVCPPIEAYAAS